MCDTVWRQWQHKGSSAPDCACPLLPAGKVRCVGPIPHVIHAADAGSACSSCEHHVSNDLACNLHPTKPGVQG
jgi:hypothetical protein